MQRSIRGPRAGRPRQHGIDLFSHMPFADRPPDRQNSAVATTQA